MTTVANPRTVRCQHCSETKGLSLTPLCPSHRATAQLGERETYKEIGLYGEDRWVEFDHESLPEGWVVERVTTHRVRCARCHAYTISGFLDEKFVSRQIAEHICDA